jgi:hypothetical protein
VARGKPSSEREEDPWNIEVKRFPLSERERRERITLILSFAFVLLALSIGIILRYTVFAARFAPKHSPLPVISSTPRPSAN